jgi:hypothetical protein
MRNNQDRFGAKQDGSSPPTEGKTLDFVKPTEFVNLPSRGTYPQGHPLHGQATLEIFYMTAKDEDILSSETLLKKGLAIERFMENVIVNKNIKPESLLIGDRNAVIIAARSSGYGNAYETSVKCPQCGSNSKEIFDLDNPKIKETIEEEEELSLSKQEDGTFLTTMPRTGYKVKFRLLNGQDELDMVAAKLNKKRTRIAGLDSSVTRQFKKMIVSIEGIEDTAIVNRFVDVLTTIDSVHLKKCYSLVVPNIEIKNNYECESCGHQQELEVPLNADFFWPNS